jgi:ATP-dependent Zn protease
MRRGRAPDVNNFGKNLALWVIIGLLLVALFNLFQGMLLLIGVWIFFMRQMQGGGGKAMGFGKSRPSC